MCPRMGFWEFCGWICENTVLIPKRHYPAWIRVRWCIACQNRFNGWFPFPHITAVDMSFCTSLRNFIQIGPPSAEKMTSCRFSRWWISAIFDFMDTMMSSLSSAPGMLVHFKLKSMHPMIRNLISVTSVHCADIIFRLSGSFRVH